MSRAWDVFQSWSLRRQVARLEAQVVQRRQRLRSIAAGIRQKAASGMVTPGALLVAVGVGVVVEQSGHRRDGSWPNLLDAMNAGLRLLLTFSSSVHRSP